MEFKEIPINRIVARRSRYDRGEVALLAQSIGYVGLLHPVTVVPTHNSYRVIAGAGRLAAAKKIGLERLWCLVFPHDIDSPQARIALFDENLARVELPPHERDAMIRARREAIEQLDPGTKAKARKAHGKTAPGKRKNACDAASQASSTSMAAQAGGISVREVERTDRRTQAAPEVWSSYAKGEIKQSQVDELVKLPPEKQIEVLPDVIGGSREATRQVVVEAAAPDRDVARLANGLKRLASACDPVVTYSSVVSEAWGKLGASIGGLAAGAAVTKIVAAHESIGRVVKIATGKGNNSVAQTKREDARTLGGEVARTRAVD